MNSFILRTYYILTSLETNTKSYLPELQRKFTEKFPEMQVSRQRIGDQRRAIVLRKLLSSNKINELKKEAQIYINRSSNQNYTSTQTTLSTLNSTQRMRWSDEINEAIIRHYFRITNIESNKTAYRHQLHQKFIADYPHLSHIRTANIRPTTSNN